MDRFLVGIVIGTIALIVVGVVAVGVAARAPASPAADPNSPIGVVQSYVEALRAGDDARARSFLTQSARDAIDKQQFPRGFRPPSARERRIVIEPVEISGD